MKSLLQGVGAMVVGVLLAGPALGETISAGKIKTILADKKEFVLTDAAGKDWMYKLADNVVINRGGKESKSDLTAGDPVNVMYDKGLLTWTAHYILVQEGATKDCELVCGTVKSYDVDKKQLSFTDEHAKSWTFDMCDAKVRLNKEASKIEGLKIGDHALLVVEKVGDKAMLRSLMAERK